ncbi:MAG: WbqC family protein, partial [Prevotellaceae bacterium]|nr:WbqC family protein [Prevotellaceae bacterium]
EVCANYTKQTLTTRCCIATSQGVQKLIIPVENPKEKCLIKDIKIANNKDWQTLHWRALKTAYNSTPFFDFYADYLVKLYEKKPVFLLDFNINLQNEILNLLNYKNNDISLSDSYKKDFKENDIDLRNLFANKKNFVNLPFNLKAEYYQMFSEKFGFQANLSIFDLLFNLGNEARIYLKNGE